MRQTFVHIFTPWVFLIKTITFNIYLSCDLSVEFGCHNNNHDG